MFKNKGAARARLYLPRACREFHWRRARALCISVMFMICCPYYVVAGEVFYSDLEPLKITVESFPCHNRVFEEVPNYLKLTHAA